MLDCLGKSKLLEAHLSCLSLSKHVNGLPGGGCGSYSVEGADGDVCDRAVAQTGKSCTFPVQVIQ